MHESATPETVDTYIAQFPPEVQQILHQVRRAMREAAADATETISYNIPAYKQHGVVAYFAAHAKHIGVYPATIEDVALAAKLEPYHTGKGTYQFRYDQPVPYDLIGAFVAARVQANQQKATSKRKRGSES